MANAKIQFSRSAPLLYLPRNATPTKNKNKIGNFVIQRLQLFVELGVLHVHCTLYQIGIGINAHVDMICKAI